MNREQFDSLARSKAGPPREMSDAALQRDFFVRGEHNAQLPPERWPTQGRKGRVQPGAAGELEPQPRVPCPHKLCDGTGQRLLKHNPHTGTKTYILCPCQGGRA